MINLFGPYSFLQIADTSNTISLRINKKSLEVGIVSIKAIEASLNRLYAGDCIIDEY